MIIYNIKALGPNFTFRQPRGLEIFPAVSKAKSLKPIKDRYQLNKFAGSVNGGFNGLYYFE